jgi:hypothetical protein
MFTKLENGNLKYAFEITPTMRKNCIEMKDRVLQATEEGVLGK